MTLRIRDGIVEKSALTERFPVLALVHGGAGPADPKGEKALVAMRAMAEITERLQAIDFSAKDPAGEYLEFHLSKNRAPRTPAELLALAAAAELERDPHFNAGYGSAIQSDGIVRTSASFMESTRRRFSAVTNVTSVLHSSQLAYYLQKERFSMLDGHGARELARELGIPRAELVTVERFRKWARQREKSLKGELEADGTGTIGCVAVSAANELAAVTSTGGTGNETVGRIGDTPTASGNYCTRKVAVSCTGYGEQIVDLGLATRIAVRVEDGTPLRSAVEKTLKEAKDLGHEYAAIAVALDPQDAGKLHWVSGSTARHLAWAAITPDGVLSE